MCPHRWFFNLATSVFELIVDFFNLATSILELIVDIFSLATSTVMPDSTRDNWEIWSVTVPLSHHISKWEKLYFQTYPSEMVKILVSGNCKKNTRQQWTRLYRSLFIFHSFSSYYHFFFLPHHIITSSFFLIILSLLLSFCSSSFYHLFFFPSSSSYYHLFFPLFLLVLASLPLIIFLLILSSRLLTICLLNVIVEKYVLFWNRE